jgi:hypothetical protein
MKGSYLIWAMVISFFVFFNGWQHLFDGATLPLPGDPNYVYYEQFRQTHRADAEASVAAAVQRSARVPAGTNPRDHRFRQEMKAAHEGYQYSEEEKEKDAVLEGRTMPTDGIFVSALVAGWQQAQNKYNQPIRVTAGGRVRGSGSITNDYVRHPIGPDGLAMIPHDIEDFEPIAGTNTCRPFSLCGLVIDDNKQQHQFQVGTLAVYPASGEIWFVINIPFRGPVGSDQDMFIRHSGKGFQVHGDGID